MSKIDIINPLTGEIKKDSYQVADRFATVDIVPKFISSYVRLHNFRSHTGSSKTKSIGDVSGGGRKPHKQKGTGNARAGSSRSSLWRGGAQVFGGFKHPLTYSVNLSKRDRRLGFEMCIASRMSTNSLFALDEFKFDIKKDVLSPDFFSFISKSRVLFVFDDSFAFDFLLKIRNYPNVLFVLDQSLNAHDLLKYDKVVVSQSVFSKWNVQKISEVI